MLCITLLHCFTVPFIQIPFISVISLGFTLNSWILSFCSSGLSSRLWMRRSTTYACGRGLQTVNWQRNKSQGLLQDLMFQGWCWFKILGQLTLHHLISLKISLLNRMLSSSLCHGENASDCFSNLLHRPARFWSSAWCRRPAWVLGHFFLKRGTYRLVSYVSCSFYIDPNRPFHLPWKSFWTVSETLSQHDVRANRHQKNPWNWLLSTVSYFLRLKFLLTMKFCEMVWRCLKWSWKTFAKALINVGCM